MIEEPYRVYVIVDPTFGARLRTIPAEEPVWIVDTDSNRLAYETVGKERQSQGIAVDLSSFKVDLKASPEEWLISEITTIDLHHGAMSHDPPWSVINVIGTPWSERIRSELAQLGFNQHKDTPEGFIARKESANK
jgi:hypothetical protein